MIAAQLVACFAPPSTAPAACASAGMATASAAASQSLVLIHQRVSSTIARIRLS